MIVYIIYYNKYNIGEYIKMSLEEKIFLARVCEQAEKFDDMVDYLMEGI